MTTSSLGDPRNGTGQVPLLTDLKAPALRQPEAVETALGLSVVGLVSIVVAMRATVTQLEAALAVEFDSHALAPVLNSVRRRRHRG